MPNENNVAAQAGDSEPRERSPYVLGVKPSTWDAQIAAQAGDEPMRAEAILNIWRDCGWASNDGNAIKFARAIIAAQVSPRATADVERDAARWRFFKEHAQDVYAGKRVCEWIGFSGVLEHGSRDAAIDFLAAIATTKPGA